MRYLRSKKFRNKYKKLIILTQILAIWYAAVIIIGTLTSNTFAYLSDDDSTKVSISSGTWWDGSDLDFIGKKDTENIKECAPFEISIEVENKGFGMIETTEYEVYFIENGNPKEKGSIVADGVIQPLESGETVKLTHIAEENGSYIFKVFQRPGYNDNYEERKEIWSKKFMINCNASKEESVINEDDKTVDIDEVVSEELINEQDAVDGKQTKETESKELKATQDDIEKENESHKEKSIKMNNNATKTESEADGEEKSDNNQNEGILEEKELTMQKVKEVEATESTEKGEE